MSHILENIGQKVKFYRTERNYTLRTLSERSGCTINYLSNLEMGKANISIQKLSDVCEALNIGLSDVTNQIGETIHHFDGGISLALSKMEVVPEERRRLILDVINLLPGLQYSRDIELILGLVRMMKLS